MEPELIIRDKNYLENNLVIFSYTWTCSKHLKYFSIGIKFERNISKIF